MYWLAGIVNVQIVTEELATVNTAALIADTNTQDASLTVLAVVSVI
jgi:hypothetical protein